MSINLVPTGVIVRRILMGVYCERCKLQGVLGVGVFATGEK